MCAQFASKRSHVGQSWRRWSINWWRTGLDHGGFVMIIVSVGDITLAEIQSIALDDTGGARSDVA